MILLAAASIASALPPSRPVTAAVQATATIRIVTAVQLKLGAAINPGAPPVRDSIVMSADGSSQPAKLIEFQ
jgi:hypothetical protein